MFGAVIIIFTEPVHLVSLHIKNMRRSNVYFLERRLGVRVSRSAVSWVIQDGTFPPFLIKLASNMEGLLQELNLSNLIDKFKEKRIDNDTILSATDSDLIRLSVMTIGRYVYMLLLAGSNLFLQICDRTLSVSF